MVPPPPRRPLATATTAVAAVTATALALIAGPSAAGAPNAGAGGRFDVDPERPPAQWVRQPAPVMTPEETIASFDLPPGFRAELVAAEPLVQDPVAIDFDDHGRIWVIEYPGYNWEYRDTIGLPDKPAPAGRVVVLEDGDGDGVMDRRTVFLDDIDNPRTLLVTGDGLLVGAPPRLTFHRDTTGDGQADEHRVLHEDFGPLSTVHAQPSGLLHAMDNRIHAARFTAALRHRHGEWQRDDHLPARGQWGLAQDNHGRQFFNTQADPLRAGLVDPDYRRRHPHLALDAGVDVRIAPDLRDPMPHDATPGVNQRWDGFLDERGRLAHFTSACSPHIHRGHRLPEEFAGDAFVCVPAANFIRHYRITPNPDGTFTAANAWAGDRREFLFAHDERFRPVQILTGPDGWPHVVDMQRGIIEGHTWISDETRDYILARELHEPFHGRGRIYRLVHDDDHDNDASAPPAVDPDTNTSDAAWNIARLGHRNGWHRDRAQRWLVQSAPDDPAIDRQLTALATDADADTLARLHALWTLDGRQTLGRETLAELLRQGVPPENNRATDPDHAALTAAALRLAEPHLHHAPLLEPATGLKHHPHPQVRRQLMHSLGAVPPNAPDNPGTAREQAEHAMRELLLDPDRPTPAWLAEAAASGLAGREWPFLEATLDAVLGATHEAAGSSAPLPPPVADLLPLAAQAIGNSGQTEAAVAMIAWIERAANDDPGHEAASLLLRGLAAADAAPLTAAIGDGESGAPARLLALPPGAVHEAAVAVVAAMRAPAAAGVREPDPDTLEDQVRARFEAGRAAALLCAACHQPHWRGQEGVAPALINSPYLRLPSEHLVRIVLGGYSDRDDFPPMAGLAALADDQVAAVLTYLRLTLGEGDLAGVDAETVAAIRALAPDRGRPWTRNELLPDR